MFSELSEKQEIVISDDERSGIAESLGAVFYVVYDELRERYIGDAGGESVSKLSDGVVVYRGEYSGFDRSGFVYQVSFEIDLGMLRRSEDFMCRIDSFRYRFSE